MSASAGPGRPVVGVGIYGNLAQHERDRLGGFHRAAVAAGLADGGRIFGDADIVLFGYLSGDHLGGFNAALVARPPFEGVAWVVFGWVEPSRRRHGLYRAMWNELLRWAAANGVRRIRGLTNLDNIGARAAFRALGRREVGVMTEYDLAYSAEAAASAAKAGPASGGAG